MSNDVSPGPGKGQYDKSGVAKPALSLSGPTSLVAIFTGTTFLSALLLFSIQPLFAKMVLPILGGAPSVWAVALCFFQGALLAGYCYAHLVNRHVPERWAGAVHLGVMALAMLSLPIGLPLAWREPPPGDPYFWQLGLFTVAVGLPFLAVSANAPLLQAWFARTGHPDGRDPYFMYAASNLGSFMALLAYPLLLEPLFGVSALSRMWTIGFVLLWLTIAVCFWSMRSSPSKLAEAATGAAAKDEAPSPTWLDRLGWIGLALVPSALLTAYTTHIATDVASAPLIWVIPLSLYLLTFVLVFRDQPIVFIPCLIAAFAAGWGVLPGIMRQFGFPDFVASSWFGVGAGIVCAGALYRFWQNETPRQWLLWFHLGALLLALLQLSQTRHDTWFVSAATGLAAFFLSGLVAHRTLYEARPAASHLTQFYLFMSLGGVLGGLFAALLAPRLFSEVLEYPILLALTMACRPGALRIDLKDKDELLRLWLLFAAGVLAIWWSDLLGIEGVLRRAYLSLQEFGGVWLFWLTEPIRWMVAYGISAVLALIFAGLVLHFLRQPVRQLVAALLMCGAVIALPSSVKRGDAERSYFGVYRVSDSSGNGTGEFNVLTHGTTLHGAQRVRDSAGNLVVDTTPGTYYHPKSPMAESVRLVRERLEAVGGQKGRYGVVGLGTGSLACYKKEGETWRFYEIDPVIVKIASAPENFSFIHYCQPQMDIVLGDARLTIAKEASQSFDLIIVDAFSSDAVPVHLLTADALRMYAAKMKPEGVIVLHISNRYLDLDGVVAATNRLVPELHGLIMSDDDADGSYGSTTSTTAVLSKSKAMIDEFRKHHMSSEFPATSLRGWTDDFSDVLGPFMSKMRR